MGPLLPLLPFPLFNDPRRFGFGFGFVFVFVFVDVEEDGDVCPMRPLLPLVLLIPVDVGAEEDIMEQEEMEEEGLLSRFMMVLVSRFKAHNMEIINVG
jgi:hypothetical protein